MADEIPKSRPDLSESDVLSGSQSIEFDPLAPDALIDEIKKVADKMVRDQTTRGDLKIILRALKELRYAFKVFKPYRLRRKVTMFGSARITPGRCSSSCSARRERMSLNETVTSCRCAVLNWTSVR